METKLKQHPSIFVDALILQKPITSAKGPGAGSSESSVLQYHRLVAMRYGKQKPCIHCRQIKAKTRTGLRIFTRFECESCNLALCNPHTSDRQCFFLHHMIPAKLGQDTCNT
jgi:hypothetical protein